MPCPTNVVEHVRGLNCAANQDEHMAHCSFHETRNPSLDDIICGEDNVDTVDVGNARTRLWAGGSAPTTVWKFDAPTRCRIEYETLVGGKFVVCGDAQSPGITVEEV